MSDFVKDAAIGVAGFLLGKNTVSKGLLGSDSNKNSNNVDSYMKSVSIEECIIRYAKCNGISDFDNDFADRVKHIGSLYNY